MLFPIHDNVTSSKIVGNEAVDIARAIVHDLNVQEGKYKS